MLAGCEFCLGAAMDRDVTTIGQVALVERAEHCGDAGIECDVFCGAAGKVLAVGAFDHEAFGSVRVWSVAVLRGVDRALRSRLLDRRGALQLRRRAVE